MCLGSVFIFMNVFIWLCIWLWFLFHLFISTSVFLRLSAFFFFFKSTLIMELWNRVLQISSFDFLRYYVFGDFSCRLQSYDCILTVYNLPLFHLMTFFFIFSWFSATFYFFHLNLLSQQLIFQVPFYRALLFLNIIGSLSNIKQYFQSIFLFPALHDEKYVCAFMSQNTCLGLMFIFYLLLFILKQGKR